MVACIVKYIVIYLSLIVVIWTNFNNMKNYLFNFSVMMIIITLMGGCTASIDDELQTSKMVSETKRVGGK